MASPAPAAQLVSKPVQPKDLINLRNPKNGEVYRFSCKTCIDGHRAPLCDPNKHSGKVVFRRPNPGRPARQCGHPKSAQCDCLAKRTLCCKLTDDEWDQVREGKVVTVAMYDSLDDLEASTLEVVKPQSTPVPGPVTYYPYPHLRMPMMGVGGPQGNVEPSFDPFDWGSSPLPKRAINAANTRPRRQGSNSVIQHPAIANTGSGSHTDQMHIFQASPQPHEDLQKHVQHAQFGQFQVDIRAQQPAFDRLDTTTPPVATPGPSSEVNTPVENGAHLLHRQLSIHQELSALSPAMQECYLRNSSSIDGVTFSPSGAMSPDPLDIDMIGLDLPLPATTQSCCSRNQQSIKQEAPRMYGNWAMPAAAPRSQFPCPSCASTMCTCSNCPSTMQNLSGGGAWAQACGRQGHLDTPFPAAYTPQLLQNGHTTNGHGHHMDHVEKYALSPTEPSMPITPSGMNGQISPTTAVHFPYSTTDTTINPSMLQYQSMNHGLNQTWPGY